MALLEDCLALHKHASIDKVLMSGSRRDFSQHLVIDHYHYWQQWTI